MKKDRLSPEEIKTVRGEIEKIEDVEEKKKLYQNLASKVIYTNQRQSVAKEADGTTYAEKSYGGMCNLASLSMVLQFLGISNPYPDLQYQDGLEKKRVDMIESGKFKKSDSRLNWDVWERLAKELGASNTKRFYPEKQNKDYYLTNLLPAIQSGAGIMLSFKGHIVRLENITDEGFIIDDPYGKSDIVTRNKNGKGGWDGYNGKRGGPSKDVGEDNLWTWDAVEQVNIRGAIVIYP